MSDKELHPGPSMDIVRNMMRELSRSRPGRKWIREHLPEWVDKERGLREDIAELKQQRYELQETIRLADSLLESPEKETPAPQDE